MGRPRGGRAAIAVLALIGLVIGAVTWAGGPLGLLMQVGAASNRVRFPPHEERVYREVEGDDLVVSIFRPDPIGEGPDPAILFIHGGAWAAGDRAMLFPYAEAFARRGWATFSIAYRTLRSHGTDAHVALSDARHALRWLHTHATGLGVDPSRIVLAGGSAGGHLAAATALIDPGFPVAGLFLLNPAIDTASESAPRAWGDTVDRFSGRGREISPAHHVAPGQPPTIVFHGVEDRLVPIEQVRRFCRAMTRSGNVCELIEVPGARHGQFNHGLGQFEMVIARTEAFLRARALSPH